MDSMTSIIAAKKMSSLKERCKMKGIDTESDSPETEQKMKERMEKDARKRDEEKAKREEKYDERERQREKLRSKIRDKYNLKDPNDTGGGGGGGEKSKKKEKPKKELREKDFYKYNKALPEERGKKLEKEEAATQDQSATHSFASIAQKLNEKEQNDTKKEEKDCVIS